MQTERIPELTCQNAVEQYIEWLRHGRRVSVHTVRAYSGDLTQWLAHFDAHTYITSVPRDTLTSFLLDQRHRGMSEATAWRRIAAITGFGRWLAGRSLIDATWDPPPVRDTSGRGLPRLASNRSLCALHRHLRLKVTAGGNLSDGVRQRPHDATTLVALSVMLTVGTRVSETAAIETSKLDLDRSSISVLGKGRRERIVYVTGDWLHQLLHSYVASRPAGADHPFLLFNRHGGPSSAAMIRYRLRAASHQAGLATPISPHMLRHAAATNLLESGVDIRFVQRLLGHASISTTEIYTHVFDGALRSVVANADVLGRLYLTDN